MIRRTLGGALLFAALLPLHRLLDPVRTGPAGHATSASAEAAWSVGLFGSMIVLGIAFVLWRGVGDGWLRTRVSALVGGLARPEPWAFALSCGLLALGLSAAAALFLFGGMPTSVDEMVQLAHAAAMRSGRLALPVDGSPAAFAVQNGWTTPSGWASIYPPLHTLALAAGLAGGVAWLVGPLAVGAGTALSALAFEHEFEDRRVARVASLLLALCPFWLLLGATHLSHSTAGLGAAAVFYTVVRARDGGLAWALAAGAATGTFVMARPLTGLAISLAVFAALWLPALARRDSAAGWLGPRVGAVVVGGAPFAAALFAWNRALFGSPLTLGYSAAFGPSHGLGFHVDPWGNQYGALEALAYTGADLVQLGAHLFESPLPATLLVAGGALLVAMPRGSRVLASWIGAALAANALYWHHGVHMGPRMLFETAPAWVGLTVLAVAAMTRPDAPSWLRGMTSWSVALALVGSVALAPAYARAVATPDEAVARARLPSPPTVPAVVFVHGSWSSRVSARLAATGMRRDSIETALRRNDLCDVDRFARLSGTERPMLDFTPLPGSPSTLVERELSEGNVVRVSPDRRPTAGCLREAASDRLGVLELEPLFWQAPPLPEAPLLVARDLGPVENARLLDSERAAYVYGDFEGSTRLLEYDEAMELLWGGAAVRPPGPDGR